MVEDHKIFLEAVLKSLVQFFKENKEDQDVPYYLKPEEVFVCYTDAKNIKFQFKTKGKTRNSSPEARATGVFLTLLNELAKWDKEQLDKTAINRASLAARTRTRQEFFLHPDIQKNLGRATAFLSENISTKKQEIAARLSEQLVECSTKPFREGEWAKLLRDRLFNAGVFRSVVLPRIHYLGVKNYVYESKNYTRTYVMSDIHADPCRFLWLLGKNELITPQKPPTYWSGALQGANGFSALAEIAWTRHPKQCLVVLGDLVDGKRIFNPDMVKEVSTTCNISREYLVHLLIMHLQLSARANNGGVYVCLGNHDVESVFMDWKGLTKHNYKESVVYNYACQKDILYFQQPTSRLTDRFDRFELWKQCLPLRSQYLGKFYFCHKNLFFEIRANSSRYFAAHAEICNHNASQEEVYNSMQRLAALQAGLRNQLTDLNTFVHELTTHLRTTEHERFYTSFFWNRALGTKLWECIDKKEFRIERTLRKQDYFICGHTPFTQKDRHAMDPERVKNHTKTIFVDRGLSECFALAEKDIDPLIINFQTSRA